MDAKEVAKLADAFEDNYKKTTAPCGNHKCVWRDVTEEPFYCKKYFQVTKCPNYILGKRIL